MVQDDQVSTTVDDSLPDLEFLSPVAGFPDHRRFVLVELGEASLLCSLRSLDEPQLRFLVLPPGPFFADYAPEIDEETASKIGLEDAADALVLLVVTVGGSAAESTANLLAPIVLNSRTRQAAQVLQASGDLPLQAPLIPAA